MVADDEWTTMQSGAGFTHRPREGAQIVERSVYCAQEDRQNAVPEREIFVLQRLEIPATITTRARTDVLRDHRA